MTEAKNTDPGKTDDAQPTAAAAVVPDPRVAELEAENARLREQLVEAGQQAEAGRPHEPSFRFTEDNAMELRTNGRTISPFTSKLYVGTSVDDAREATAEEFAKAKPPTKPARAGGSSSAAGATARGGRGGRAK